VTAKKVSKGYSAWLVRWEWSGDHARRDGDPVIAILKPQIGVDHVAKFVERYYAAATYTPTEKLAFMRRPQDNPYRAAFSTMTVAFAGGYEQTVRWDGGQIICGHNPFVVASPVKHLRPASDSPTSGLLWEEYPLPDLGFRHGGA
jgi:hypothetical protein